MSQEARTQASVAPSPTEPRMTDGVVPVWLFIVLFVLLYIGMYYFDHQGGWFNPQVYAPYKSFAELQNFQPPTGGVNLERGKTVYENVCALCHNTDGSGKPGQAPPFVGSEWVLGSPARVVRIPLVGLTGPVKVKDQEWNLSMPAMGAALSDEDLAAVLSYMRQSWGNKAAAIMPEQVKAIRTEVGGRSQLWTVPELEKFQ